MACTLTRVGWVLVAACAVLSFAAGAETVDQILATVDKEVILQSDVMSEVAADVNDLRTRGVAGADFENQAQALMKKGLDQAVEEKILLREAKLAGVTIDDADVDKQLEDIQKRYESKEAFRKDIESYGLTQSALRDKLRNRALALRMANRKVSELSKQVVVSESEVAQYYEDHKDQFKHQERVRLRQIFLPIEAGQDAAVAKARLEQIKEEVAKGADFGELAKAHSKGPAAQEGGLVGWVSRGDLVEALDKAAFALQPGQISDIIQVSEPAPGGFHLLKVEEREQAGQATLDEVRTEIEPELRQQAAKVHFQKWMDDLRRKSRVQVFL
jgi:parvulin-like peptidyl-prolyl isomerase